jgi:hypothetical protein
VSVDVSGAAVSISLDPGEVVVCTFTNDTFDLKVTKATTPGSPTSVEAGASTSYRISVDNIGSGGTAQDATLFDVLPVGFSFGSLPAGCSAVGQTLSCTIAANLLDPSDPAVVIDVPVTVAGSTAAGTYTNVAVIDHPDDDGECEPGQACVPSPCPAEQPATPAGNNKDCETTTVVRGASITVVKQTRDGETTPLFWTFNVNGPSLNNAAVAERRWVGDHSS